MERGRGRERGEGERERNKTNKIFGAGEKESGGDGGMQLQRRRRRRRRGMWQVLSIDMASAAWAMLNTKERCSNHLLIYLIYKAWRLIVCIFTIISSYKWSYLQHLPSDLFISTVLHVWALLFELYKLIHPCTDFKTTINFFHTFQFKIWNLNYVLLCSTIILNLKFWIHSSLSLSLFYVPGFLEIFCHFLICFILCSFNYSWLGRDLILLYMIQSIWIDNF